MLQGLTHIERRPSAKPRRRSVLMLVALCGSVITGVAGVVTGPVVALAAGTGGTVPAPITSNVVTESSSMVAGAMAGLPRSPLTPVVSLLNARLANSPMVFASQVISANGSSAVAVKSDGTVWTWG